MNKNIAFDMLAESARKIILAGAVFLLLMTVFRAAFFVYYGGLRTVSGLWADVLKAFFMGMRFDLGVVAYVSLPATLALAVVAVAGKKMLFAVWQICARYYYGAMFTLVFILLCVDFGFYSYFKNHINIIIFGVIEDDTRALLSTLIENYNIPLVVLIFLVIGLGSFMISSYFFGRLKVSKKSVREYPFLVKFAVIAGLVSLNALAARGSLGLFPLGTMDAEISPDVFINKVAINGIYTLQEALEARLKENGKYDITRQLGYENDPEKAFLDFLGVPAGKLNTASLPMNIIRKTKKNRAAEELKPNVILIMMEGFGSDLLKYNSEDFDVMGELKEHFASDTVFMNFISGDVGTIGSIETVVLNMPKRPNSKAVTQSEYAYNPYFTGAAMPFKQSGYETIFLYGGNAGWRNVFLFAENLGFDSAEGAGSMNPKYPRNQWGVYDEYLFDHVFAKLEAGPQKPKFMFVMTTSNHPPYSLPKDYRKLPLSIPETMKKEITGDKELAVKRFETYQYANHKLGEFITKVKSSKYGANTIIAVTGDHNFWSVFDYPRERYLDLDGVPFYLYVPERLKPARIDAAVFGSHLDIMPTLYNISLSDQEYAALGIDMLDRDAEHIAFNADGLIMSSGRAMRYLVENNTASYYVWDPAEKRLLKPSAPDAGHEKMLRHFKSALAVADYLIKNPMK